MSFFVSTVTPLKILFVENSCHTTGAFNSMLAIIDALDRKCKMEVILPSSSTLLPQVVATGVICHRLPISEIGRSMSRLTKYLPLLLCNTWRLHKILRKREIDILVINDYYNLLGFMVRAAGWRGCLLTYVRLLPSNQQPVLNWWWIRLAIKASDKVLAVSNAVAADLPVSDRVAVLYDPCSFSSLSSVSAEDHQRNGSEIRCLYLANYIAGKGHRFALQAFASAYLKNPKLRLNFVGGDMGLTKNSELRRTLEAETAALGLSTVVSFFGFTSNVSQEMRSADIFLNFSESESFSQTCLEASANGLPVIATRCGGPEEIIDDGTSGLLVPVSNVQAMSDAILKLAADSNLRKHMGAKGAAIVRERFSEERFLAGFLPLCHVASA